MVCPRHSVRATTPSLIPDAHITRVTHRTALPTRGQATLSAIAVSEHILKLSILPMTPSRTAAPDPRDLLPLKPIELLILTMLTAGERHGYGLRRDIVAHTEGRVSLEAGNLYRHIRNLQQAGLVDETEPKAAAGDDERRIYYRLQPFGKKVLAAELQRLRDLIRIAEDSRVLAPSRS